MIMTAATTTRRLENPHPKRGKRNLIPRVPTSEGVGRHMSLWQLSVGLPLKIHLPDIVYMVLGILCVTHP